MIPINRGEKEFYNINSNIFQITKQLGMTPNIERPAPNGVKFDWDKLPRWELNHRAELLGQRMELAKERARANGYRMTDIEYSQQIQMVQRFTNFTNEEETKEEYNWVDTHSTIDFSHEEIDNTRTKEDLAKLIFRNNTPINDFEYS